MKREDITNIFPDATPEQINKIMSINGGDINAAKQGSADLQAQLTAANGQLEKLRGIEEAHSAAAGRVKALETELGSLKAANQLREMREQVAKTTGVPANLLTGETEEACQQQAAGILSFAKFPTVPDGGEPGGTARAPEPRDEFADWFTEAIK